MQKHFLLLLAISSLCACDPKVDSRGHVRDVNALTELKAGEATRDKVMELYGSPSTTSSFGGETWYYITAKKEAFAFFKPELVDQEVVRITFDQAGVVQDVKRFDKASMQEIALATKETPTEGQELTFIEQLLGNTGRFNSPAGTPGQGTSGARGRR